jgi:peptide/nickel transport system substrate-binding protein
MSFPRIKILIAGLVLVLGSSAACSAIPPAFTTPQASPTPTPEPPRLLTVCLGQEPQSLFPINNPSSAARSVLAALYDGPIDTNSYGYQPVILQGLPSIDNGDAQLFLISVYVGDEVIDADDRPATLAPGVKVRPAGCRDGSCVITYDGKSELQMDQMQVTFRLLPGLNWSDGEPLTADDSVYAFNLAADPDWPGSNYLYERTQSYEAADEQTVQWWGKPGFVDPTYLANFWFPLPEHAWGDTPVDALLDSADIVRAPLGWGPYVIQEWADGDHITLVKNPRYFRAGEGLPVFDLLTFRFVPDPETAISNLIAGTCDILDPSVDLDGQVGLLRSMDEQGQLRALITPTPVMEQLALGIRPAAYDNGYNPGLDRPDFFGDARVRRAVAMCIDRQQAVDVVLHGLSSVPASFVPEAFPLFDSTVPAYSFDPAAANALLQQTGWLDSDQDPATPRRASGVSNVPAGTPFEVTYTTTSAIQRQQVSSILVASLAQCGIRVEVQYVGQETLYAQGPAGLLFGRSYHMVEFAMGSSGSEPHCEWYSSSEVPNAANRWIGTNVSGYNSPVFDSACRAARQSLPDEDSYAQAYRQAQSVFAQDLPVIPLYWRVKAAAARSDICSFSLDPTAASALWNIENIDAGPGCRP